MHKDILNAAQSSQGLEGLSEKALMDSVFEGNPVSPRFADILMISYVAFCKNIPERVVESVCNNRRGEISDIIRTAAETWNDEAKLKKEVKGITMMGLSLLISNTGELPDATRLLMKSGLEIYQEQITKIIDVV